VCEVGGVDLGIVGTKGFVGGFPGAEIPDFGEPLLRSVYHETTLEVEALEAGLEEVAGCHRRVVLSHYEPVAGTLVGSLSRSRAFLGSSRLATPIGAHRPDLVLHAHAHRGSFAGAVL
jgi:Icc-related predicted phosphoesterase